MLQNIKPRERELITECSIEFTNSDGCGYSFDADENGNVILSNDDQRENYEWAMAHKDKFDVQYNEFVKSERWYINPAQGTCPICGGVVILENEHMGACSCGRCGQWYNLFGQMLVDPIYWND